MALKPMIRSKADDTGGGGWWHTELTVTSGVSDTWLLPVQPIMSIGARVVGSGILSFTLDQESVLVSGGNFEDWDGIAKINPAVTGFRFTCASGTATAVVCVKTFYAS